MKTLAIIISSVVVFSLSSMAQNPEISKLLKDPKTRTEIFNTIMNDHQLMMDFMGAMDGNQHATMMMGQHMQMNEHHEMMQMNSDSARNRSRMMQEGHNTGMMNGNQKSPGK